ncbi:hypothetical protein FVE85_7125 [Porphyridium purpureum]|uniref:Uncharacterized protein n=1 Tax=Porphyridium purpureum TaxID=35688 RepID=A0A5J4Z8W1_PORPP|nr:hypothetical protein FVE85_7125 [Porphyridium purpureum]|eukprot:POR3876..scf295_1
MAPLVFAISGELSPAHDIGNAFLAPELLCVVAVVVSQLSILAVRLMDPDGRSDPQGMLLDVTKFLASVGGCSASFVLGHWQGLHLPGAQWLCQMYYWLAIMSAAVAIVILAYAWHPWTVLVDVFSCVKQAIHETESITEGSSHRSREPEH